jgi:hypothetical protein
LVETKVEDLILEIFNWWLVVMRGLS